MPPRAGSVSVYELGKFVVVAAVSFLIGRSWHFIIRAVHQQDREDATTGQQFFEIDDPDIRIQQEWMDMQWKAYEEIQHHIEQVQNPSVACSSSTTRFVVSKLEHPKDGFASEVQYVSRLLQMAVSTGRILVFDPDWKSAYEPLECRSVTHDQNPHVGSGWTCLWDPISKCSFDDSIQNRNDDAVTLSSTQYAETMALVHHNPLNFGVLNHKTTSTFFDARWYSSSIRQVLAPVSFPRHDDRLDLRPDVISHWERVYGRFLMRGFMANSLWKPNPMLQSQIKARMPPALLSSEEGPSSTTSSIGTKSFIGFHIRYTDNIHDFRRHFARNATSTRSFERFMAFAEQIRNDHPDKNLRLIFLATDNDNIVKQSQHQKWKNQGWKFLFQNNVERSTSVERLWFRGGRGSAAGAIAADIEVLRRADFVVGSFQSNVMRLACELNSIWHVKKYPFQMLRHYSVDIEWYEDP